MIIHSPIISGSMTFADGASVTYPEGGVYSGSFSGSFQGEGSNLTFGGTGIVSSSAQIDDLFNIDGVVSSSEQIVDVLSSLNSYTASNDTTNSTQNSRLDQLSTETGSISSEQAAQDSRLDQLSTETGSISSEQAAQDSRLDQLSTETGSISTEQSAQDSRLSNIEAATSSYQPTLSITDTTNVDLILSSNTLSANLKGGVVSGSAQITDVLSSLNSYTSSNDTTNSTQDTRLNQLSTETGSIASEQSVQDSRLSNLESATGSYQGNLSVSDSSQVDMILSGDTLSANLKGGVISGSSQVDHDQTTNYDANEHFTQANITTVGTVTSGNVQAILPSGTVSGSSQIDFATIQPIGVISGSEQVEDVVGGMVTGNTETGISVAYQDGDGTLDFAVQYGSTANTAVQGNTSITFAGTSNEITIDGGSSITLGSGGTVTIGLADSITGNRTFSNNVTITGDLTVNGTTTTVNSNTVNIGDNILVLNSDETGTPSQNGGIEIERGTSTNSSLIWSEANDYWVAGLAGAEERIVIGAGNTSITTLGTITTGTWNGTAIADSYIASAATWNAIDTSVPAITSNGSTPSLNTGITAAEVRSLIGVDAAGTINYTHPTHPGDDINIDTTALTGATVISDLDFNITTDTLGHVTDANATVSTRDLTKSDIGLGSVENTALSTWAGSSNITTLGTISTGTWNGTAIADAYLSSNTAHLSGTQTFSGAKTFSAITTISNATASTTKTTGALIVTGGVGVSGALNVGGDVVAYASSDERLKDNIELISNPIEKVQALKGVTWNWNDNADELQQSLPNVGVIAQDVEKVLPQLVHDRDNGFKGVDYAKLTGLLIEAIKEQQKQIDDLKSKIQ